jgi:hypothetical protein
MATSFASTGGVAVAVAGGAAAAAPMRDEGYWLDRLTDGRTDDGWGDGT